jgi:hypothetical protein
MKIYFKKFFSCKTVFLRFQNIEYKSSVPTGIKVNDFLDTFAKGRKANRIDYEIFKSGYYLSGDKILDEVNTTCSENDPLTIVEDTFTVKNMKYRKINHLTEPYNTHSNKFQDYLNTFLEKYNVDKVNNDDIVKYVKTVDSIKSSEFKLSQVVSMLLKNCLKNIKVMNDYTLDMNGLDKKNENGLIILKTHNDLKIPLSLVIDGDNFDEKIMKNFTTLKKLCLKEGVNSSFGIITDLNKWKVICYQKCIVDGKRKIESEDDFLLSLKYDLGIGSSGVNETSYQILMKIITGISDIKQEDISKNI